MGHVTLATGAIPAVHGMIGNVWFDRGSGEMIYNIEDERYGLLTEGADVDKSSEIDPTQKIAGTDGRSPSAILSSTFSDELAVHYFGRSKIFAVSVKDRGAVSLAGHAGKAFWFSKAGGEFVTSTYYLDQYPDWVNVFNATKPAQQFAGTEWQLLHDRDTYLFGDSDDRPWETDVGGFGRTFPHSFGDGSSRYFTTWLTLSPPGDRLVLDFAKQALLGEQLGQEVLDDHLLHVAVAFVAGGDRPQAVEAVPERPGRPLRHGLRAGQAADAPQAARDVRQPARSRDEHGRAQLRQALPVARGIAAPPRDHQVRAEPDDGLEVEPFEADPLGSGGGCCTTVRAGSRPGGCRHHG